MQHKSCTHILFNQLCATTSKMEAFHWTTFLPVMHEVLTPKLSKSDCSFPASQQTPGFVSQWSVMKNTIQDNIPETDVRASNLAGIP